MLSSLAALKAIWTVALEFFKFITNPSVMIALAASVAVWWAVQTHADNIALHNQVNQQTLVISQLNQNSKIQDGDIQRVQTAINSMSDLKVSQNAIQKQIASIPSTSKDTPFADANLLHAGQLLRDNQNNSASASASGSVGGSNTAH